MGKIEEHWCNVCRRSLDKNKDEYIDFEFVNMPKAKKQRRIGQRLKKPKGIICMDCIEKNPALKNSVEEMIKAGNPTFKPSLYCRAAVDDSCEDYSPNDIPTEFQIQIGDKKYPKMPYMQRCTHIAVIGDTLYCKRSHPGKLALPQEVAEIERFKRQLLLEEMQRFTKDPKITQYLDTVFFKKQLEGVYISPSNVVEEPKQ